MHRRLVIARLRNRVDGLPGVLELATLRRFLRVGELEIAFGLRSGFRCEPAPQAVEESNGADCTAESRPAPGRFCAAPAVRMRAPLAVTSSTCTGLLP